MYILGLGGCAGVVTMVGIGVSEPNEEVIARNM
jgi:hypothetical protein